MQFGVYERDEKNLIFEVEFAEYLKSNGLPIPQIYKTIAGEMITSVTLEGEKHFVVLFEFIKGKEINIFNKSKIQNVARMQAKMHHLTKNWKPSCSRFLSGYTNNQDWLREIDKEFNVSRGSKYFTLYQEYKTILAKISEKILASEPRKMSVLLIHADVHEGNMRFAGDEIAGLFDFDDCRMSIVPEDIGMFLSVLLRTGNFESVKKKAKIYFEEYSKFNKISLAEMDLSFYFAVEKWLVPKFSKLREQIESGNVDAKKFTFSLRQSKWILKLVRPFSDSHL